MAPRDLRYATRVRVTPRADAVQVEYGIRELGAFIAVAEESSLLGNASMRQVAGLAFLAAAWLVGS